MREFLVLVFDPPVSSSSILTAMDPPIPEASDIEEAARCALEQAGAIRTCHLHPTITIRLGNEEAELRAQVLVKTVVIMDRSRQQADDVIRVMQRQLREAAQGDCPECEALVADHA
jgi:hypothetical protein